MTGMVPSRHSISLLVPSLNTTIHKTACMINHFLQTQQVYQTLQIPRRDDQEWIYIPIPSHSFAVNSHCYPFSFPGLSLIPISEKFPLGYSHSQTRYQNNKVVNVNSWQLCNRKAVPQKTGHHTHPFNGPLSRTTQLSRYQKGKTNLDFTAARDSEW